MFKGPKSYWFKLPGTRRSFWVQAPHPLAQLHFAHGEVLAPCSLQLSVGCLAASQEVSPHTTQTLAPVLGARELALPVPQVLSLTQSAVAAQIEREAAKVNERHGWFKEGDAWGYRRAAYRKMAELLQGPALAAYDAVFSREPSHTKHICQSVTPALLAPVKPKVYVE